DPAAEHVDERRNVPAETDAAPRLFEVLTTDASKLRIVANQVRELSALLHEVAARATLDFLLKAGCADQLAEHEPRVAEAPGLIEIGREQEMLAWRRAGHGGPRMRCV